MVGLIEIPTAQRGRKRRQCRSRRDSAIGRLSYIMDGANSGDSGQIPEQYSYLSLNTIVGVTRPQTGIDMSLLGPTGSVSSAIGLPNTDQSRTYSLDGLGNWKKSVYLPEGSATSETDQRNNNYVNQITQRSVAGGTAVTFEYDGHATPMPGNGNLTDDGTLIYSYDALNRLIGVNRVSEGAAIAAYVYDAGNRRVRKTVTNGGLAGNIPNGTTDSCWFGWQTMEERNPFGGSGGTDTPTKEFVWGAYIDECIQIHLLVPAGPQGLPSRHYYLLQDTLYRAVALTNSGGEIQEAYDTDAYGNTLIFTGPGADNTWFTDDDLQSSYGANDIIYCGYRYDAETDNYYVRNRYYSPILGRWLTRDPIGYQGGINLYGYVENGPVGKVDAAGRDADGFGIPSGMAMPAPGYYVSGYGGPGGTESVRPLSGGAPASTGGFVGTNLSKKLLDKLGSYAIGASLSFSLQNTVIELPPPYGMVLAVISANGRIVACKKATGARLAMFVGEVSVGVGWGEGIVEKDTASGGGPTGASKGGGLGASHCERCKNTLRFNLTVFSEAQAGFSFLGVGGQAGARAKIGSYAFPNGPWRWSLAPFASVSAVDGEDFSLALTVMGEASGKGQLVLP